MEDLRYIMTRMTQLLHTGVVGVQDSCVQSYEEAPQYNPLYENAALRCRLREAAAGQTLPYIYRDDYDVFYVCVHCQETGTDWFMGPLATANMSRVERHRFYHAYGIEEQWEKGLHYHTLIDILRAAGMLANLLTGKVYTEQMLLDANDIAPDMPDAEREQQEQIQFSIQSDDEDLYRHTYQEERALLDTVRTGNVTEAIRLTREMDDEIGRLGSDELTHWQNLLIVSVTLCARAAIEGGLQPYVAYRVSGFYINKGSAARDIAEVLTYRNHAIEELAGRVQELHARRHTSNYTEQCKDYVRKHYRERIYVADIAQTMGISEGYLSRLFRKETGTCLQDFINDVRVERAANLLVYSEETLSGIAEYVGFPSQSYFGRIFKGRRQMTPRQYRERYKPTEFVDHSKNNGGA